MDFYSDITLLFGGIHKKPVSGFIDLDNRDYYCLQYNHGGRITVQVGENSPVEVTGPSLLITVPKTHFIFGTDTGSWLHNAMGFKGERVAEYIRAGLLPANVMPPVFPIRDSENFYISFCECVYNINQGKNNHPRAVNLLEKMLIQLYEERLRHISEGSLAAKVRECSRHLQQNTSEAWDIVAEAEKLHISYAHFRRVFKEVTGFSPQQFMQQCRLSRASELLVTTSMPIKEVAWSVGIKDIYHFSKIFKNRYELPPGQFRKLHGTFPEKNSGRR